MYTDKPKPSSFLIGMLVLIMLFLIVMFIHIARQSPFMVTLIVGAIYVIPFIILTLIIHACRNTTYQIDDQYLYLQCGVIMKKEMLLHDIQGIKKAAINLRSMGYGIWATGYCNRFTHGIKIAASGRYYYISPTDNNRFLEEIYSRRPDLGLN